MIQKLTSRKLLLTLGAIVAAYLKADDPTVFAIVASATTAVYVLVEGLVDKARAEEAARAIERGIEHARRLQ